ncbi:MAG: EamA family transporter [Woeseiaceae bacterium]|nr:EamA family transporter [Woeseiaceae bacterium]
MNNTLLYIATVLIWGSTWLAIEYQLGVVEPEVSIAYRYILAAGVLFFWCKINRISLLFELKYHLWFAALGLLLFCLNYVFAYRAQEYITSAMAAILFSTMVWINILLARLVLGVRSTRRGLVGALLGIIGIVVLFAPRIESLALDDEIFLGSAIGFAGAFVASCGNIVSQMAQNRSLPVVAANTWGMSYGALFTTLIALGSGHEFNFDASFTYISSLVYLSIFGSVIAFGAYLTLLGRIGAHRAGYATVMFPVVALLLSILFEGLRLDATILAGVFLVLLGNTLVLNRRA